MSNEATFPIVDTSSVPAGDRAPQRVVTRAFIDVLLFDTPDGGEIEIVQGRTTMERGYRTAAYLSILGGNADDSGGPGGLSKQWWGNLTEPDPAKRLRSETQHLLMTRAATPANLKLLEDAAGRDLAWITGFGVEEIRVEGAMPRPNFVELAIELDVDGQTVDLNISTPWGVE